MYGLWEQMPGHHLPACLCWHDDMPAWAIITSLFAKALAFHTSSLCMATPYAVLAALVLQQAGCVCCLHVYSVLSPLQMIVVC